MRSRGMTLREFGKFCKAHVTERVIYASKNQNDNVSPEELGVLLNFSGIYISENSNSVYLYRNKDSLRFGFVDHVEFKDDVWGLGKVFGVVCAPPNGSQKEYVVVVRSKMCEEN